MVALSLSLTVDATTRIYDAVTCLAKFSDSVFVEAHGGGLCLTTLNSSKSAYASFSFDKSKFFTKYCFSADQTVGNDRFTCRIYNKALLSVFKGRVSDTKSSDNAIARCEVSLQDRPDQTLCRLVFKFVYDQGVTKTYKLTYESVPVMHALFEKSSAQNQWRTRSRILRDFIEYFGPKTEQLDIYYEDNRVTFTSFTEKIMDGKEVLKQPLQTAVSVSTADFERFDVQEKMHIIISVKDFRSIITHADTLKSYVTALYSVPTRPLQLAYSAEGMQCEFTLMTTGENQGAVIPAASKGNTVVATTIASAQENETAPEMMQPPSLPASRSAGRRLNQMGSTNRSTTKRNVPEGDSLFVPLADEDRGWDPQDNRGDDEVLGWDASATNETLPHPTFTDSGIFANPKNPDLPDEGLAPTQRISQIHGLFD